MITTIQRYLIGRLLSASLIIVVAICGPICLLALFKDVPMALLYSNTVWPILYGIVPTAVYLSLPLAVAIASTSWYGTLVSDSMLAALYAARYSPVAVVAPAILAAAAGAVLCAFISCVVVPNSTTRLYDILHLFEHNLSPSYLEAENIYQLDHGRRTFTFNRWVGDEEIEGVFLRELNDKQDERTIIAPRGKFVELAQESILVLRDGVIQTVHRGERDPTIVKFDIMTAQTGLNGHELPKRNWFGMFELGPVEFLHAFAAARNDPVDSVRWTSEALKRFGAPVLTIAHTLLGVGLVMFGGAVGRRKDWGRLPAIYGVLTIVHLGMMFASEGLVSIDVRIAWAIVAAIGLEMAIGIFLVWSCLSREAAPRPVRLAPLPQVVAPRREFAVPQRTVRAPERAEALPARATR